jgi:DNA-binding NarL/FixJ family response regulator
MIRVFIADDHRVVRAGLKLLLSTAPDMTVAGEASDGHAVLNALETTPCDVLLLDLSLPTLNGVEVLRRARDRFPKVHVLILSMYAEEQYALRMMRAGADGYLSKDRSEQEVIQAIRQISEGRPYFTSTVADAVRDQGDRSGHEALSGRENQIFLLIANGRTVSDIAAELDLTASTVSSYLGRIRTKLNVRTTGEIITYAHRAGLVR